MIRIKQMLLLVALGLLAPLEAVGQPIPGFLNNWTNASSGDWTNASNWDGTNIPDGQGVLSFGDDYAIIDNGGEAIVSSPVVRPGAIPGGVGIGSDNGTSGTLTIQDGGVLEVLGFEPSPEADGAVQIGRQASGLGTLNISGNGTLTAESLATGGAAGTSLNLSDSANVSLTGLANLGRITRIDGPNVDFSTTGDLQLRTGGTLIAGITGSTHSPLKAAGTATVAGDLVLQFSSTPTPGDSWQIVDAAAIAGTFTSIDSNVVLGLGQLIEQRVTNTGTVNGSALELFVDQRLLLNVNRDTGEVTIENVGGSIDLDAYSVMSAGGGLDQSEWIQFGSPWDVANADSTKLNELRRVGVTSLASGTHSLGDIYSPGTPLAFGESVEDLVFSYSGPDDSGIEGVVQYTGTTGINNLTLIVDPTTGQTQLKNTSNFDVSIDGYSIASVSDSLSPADWTSLTESDSSWDEANSETDRVSELRPTGATLLASGATIDLGMLFDETDGSQDLDFEFLLDADADPRAGEVVYQEISTLAGDFDGDGNIDGNDFLTWQRTDSTPSGLDDWTNNYGNNGALGAGAGIAAVPEPSSVALLVTLALFAGLRVQRKL